MNRTGPDRRTPHRPGRCPRSPADGPATDGACVPGYSSGHCNGGNSRHMSLLQRVERHKRGGDTAVATIGKPTEQAPRKPTQRSREDLLADIRDLIQEEVEKSFEELLDAADAEDAKTRITGIVDRI